MCLYYTEKAEKVNGKGYKVFDMVRERLFAPYHGIKRYPTNKWIHEKGFRPFYAGDTDTMFFDKRKNIPFGFCLCLTKKSAEVLRRVGLPNRVIKKVEYRKAHTRGMWSSNVTKCIIAEEIKILED